MEMEKRIFEKMQYVIRYPENYETSKKYPVLFFLHGAGSRSNDIDTLLKNPFFEITNEKKDFPFVTVAPLCSVNSWFDKIQTLKGLVEKVSQFSFTDEKRIYLMGASMGGYATWQLAMSMPEYFTAIVPVCGGGMYWNADRLINIPVWAFHGEKDETVYVEESKKMVNAVNNCGGNAKLTIYPENDHDSWNDTYKNKEVFEWLLAQEK